MLRLLAKIKPGMRLLKDGERMEFNVKENKCFKPALALKYKGAQTATVPGDDFEYMTFYDDAITSDSVAVISIVHADSSTIKPCCHGRRCTGQDPQCGCI